MTSPRVTVLMSVFNGGSLLGAAIESVLKQTFGDFEFLIVDDASTDETPAILNELKDTRVRIERNEQQLGLTASLNRGLALARGELIARQDADDLSHPDRLRRQIEFLDSNPGVAAVGSQARLVDRAGRSLGTKDFPLSHMGIRWMHLFDNALAHSAVTFRKSAVESIGGYDETFRASQDYDLWSRLSEKHALANLPERLITLTILESSVTRTHRQPELIRQVQATHSQRIIPNRRLEEEELAIVGKLRSRVEPSEFQLFRSLFDELLSEYRAKWGDSADLRRTVALQHERIGYNLLSLAPALAWKEIGSALAACPPRILELPWIRIMALTVLGDRARSLYEKLTCKAS